MIVSVVFAREIIDAHLVDADSYPLLRRLHDGRPGLVRRRANGAAEGNPGRHATLDARNGDLGYLTADLPPALTIKSGQTVKIDTVSHQGLLTKDDPVTFFGKAGISQDQVLQDAMEIYKTVPRSRGMSVQVLTGPIYVEGAAPGDMLEVRVHKLELRVPYGVNNSGPISGVLPGLLSAPAPMIIKFDMARS
jgi:acetamidase/formamidase